MILEFITGQNSRKTKNNRKTQKILHFYYSSLVCQKAIAVVSTVVKLENFNNTK